MRLTADLILGARTFINPLKERELDVRGYRIAQIENLGVTKDQFDTLDLSDNEIRKLENFPRLQRLRCVLLSNNHVSLIDPAVYRAIPNLETLVLTNNRVRLLFSKGMKTYRPRRKGLP